MQTLCFVLPVVMFFQAPPSSGSVVPAGTRVEAKLESGVETATSNRGDAVAAVLTTPIRAAGSIVIPRGSRLHGRVETISRANDTVEGRVRLVFREIRLPDGRTIPTWITNSFSASSPNRTRRHVLYMSIGAAAGAVLGGHKARTAGIIGGLIAGFVIAGNAGEGKLQDLSLKVGRTLELQLGQDLEIRGQ